MKKKCVNEKQVFLGCGISPELQDEDAKAVLWINDYYMNKAKELNLYSEEVEHYVMPKFWQTQKEFCQAKEYCIAVHKIMIADLAKQLDLMHHSSFGERGWNILIGDWLRVYIEGFYDKYARMKYAAEYYPDLYIKENATWYIPRGRYLQNNEILQGQMYRDVYSFAYLGSVALKPGDEQHYEVMQEMKTKTPQNREGSAIRRGVVKVIKGLLCKKDVTLYINTSYLALSKTTLELLSRGRIQRLTLPNMKCPTNSISLETRKLLKRDVDYGDAFINLVYDCIGSHIPMECVEDFHDYYIMYQNAGLQTNTKIVDAITVYGNFLFKIFAADTVNKGGKLEIIQHGGNYCVERYIGLYEFQFASKFYTWGNAFVRKNTGNMYPMPMPKILSIKKRKQNNILFVGYVNYPYVARIGNLYAMKMEEFYEQEDLFFCSLDLDSRQQLCVRCYHEDPWWERRKRLAQKFPWMQFDSNRIYYKSMTEAKLVVTNVISTTCMESINCDIPTIIFCSDDFFVPDENAVEILNELRRVKVLFDDPKEAADFINNNLECIDAWWKEPERKAVVSRFREMYASRGRFPKLKWIREMLKESKAM